MSRPPAWTAFVAMAREEWRLHSRLFGGRRFGAFPLFVVATVVGAVWVLDAVGTDLETIQLGVHALAFVFGLHTGSLGFVGRDAMRNLLGDVTLVVFSARTLPIGRRPLFLVFLVKDVAYYGGLFLAPLAVGTTPALVAAGHGPWSVATAVAALWGSLLWTFVLGLVTTVAAIGLLDRGLARRLLAVAAVAGLVAGWVAGVDLLAYTPPGMFLEASLERAIGAAALTAVVAGVAAVTFTPAVSTPQRTRRGRFRTWDGRIDDPVATRTVIEVHRSAGGFLKLFVSGAILLAVTAVLIAFAESVTDVDAAVGPAFGTVLGLSGFTTYNWLTQGDAVGPYLAQPLGVADVVRGKARAFAVVAPAVGGVFYLGAVAWFGADVLGAVVGGVLLLGVTWYTLGLTVLLAGLWPNEFLYDTVLFAAMWVGIGVVLVPVLVAALVLAPLEPPAAIVLAALGLALAIVGRFLAGRAGPRWDRRYRHRAVPDG